jgi:hypothetical protein
MAYQQWCHLAISAGTSPGSDKLKKQKKEYSKHAHKLPPPPCSLAPTTAALPSSSSKKQFTHHRQRRRDSTHHKLNRFIDHTEWFNTSQINSSTK